MEDIRSALPAEGETSEPRPLAALWTPLLIGGIAAAVLARSGLLHRLLGPAGAPADRRLNLDRRLAQLQARVHGLDKQAVRRTLGPPRSISGFNQPSTDDPMHADTWYYPLDRLLRSGAAIEFEQGRVRTVHLLQGPPRILRSS